MSEIKNQKVSSELEELRKKAAALREKREAQKVTTDEKIEVKMLQEEIVLDGLIADHGELGRDIGAVFSPKTGEMVVVRCPSKPAWRKYQAEISGSKVPLTNAMVELVQGILIYPTPEKFSEIQDHTPAMLGKCVNMGSKLAGVTQEEIEGK